MFLPALFYVASAFVAAVTASNQLRSEAEFAGAYAQLAIYSSTTCFGDPTAYFDLALDSCIPLKVGTGNSIYLNTTSDTGVFFVEYSTSVCTGLITSQVITTADKCTATTQSGLQLITVSATGVYPPPPIGGTITTSTAFKTSCEKNIVETVIFTFPANGKCPANINQNLKCVSSTSTSTGLSTIFSVPLNVSVSCNAPPSSSSPSCFTGSETVLMASGETRAISEITVGDEIAVATMDGTFAGYSPVIAVPHAKNSIKASFAQINTVSGRDIKMTADHLVLGGSCAAPSLVQAGSLKAGECVQTVSGAETISSVSTVESEGIYTVVTKHDGLLIVNGIVASPFAVNHLVTNSFYNILRFVYGVLPSVMKVTAVSEGVRVFGDVFTGVFA